MSDSEKHIRVWNGDDVHDVIVRPRTTAADILAAIGQEPNGYWLAPINAPPFSMNAELYKLVLNGDKLIAIPDCDGMA